jgi:photosystem II stability/assembly factor-like uncharacterized protein
MTVTKEYVVGAKLAPSGLFIRSEHAGWQHAGYNHPFVFGLDYDLAGPTSIYLAAGNGLIKTSKDGTEWKFLTGSDVTELRDVAVDRKRPGTIYFAHSAGIRVSRDAGTTWQELAGALHRKFTETIRVDREHAGVLLAGTEEGIFRSEDGRSWRLAGASGFQVTRIEQSPHDACYWLASTQGGGLFASRDCGKTFENSGNLGVGRTLYDIAFDPGSADRIAVAGWGLGVALSGDGGKSWQLRNAGLPRTDVWSVIFEPGKPGRLYASVHEEALYVSDDLGLNWKKEGLDGGVVYRMKFIP